MVRLKAKNDRQGNEWYFHNKEDARMFMGVFEDHGCDIKWKMKKGKFSDMDDEDIEDIDEDPERRALDELDWAFNSYLPDNPECDISKAIASQIKL